MTTAWHPLALLIEVSPLPLDALQDISAVIARVTLITHRIIVNHNRCTKTPHSCLFLAPTPHYLVRNFRVGYAQN